MPLLFYMAWCILASIPAATKNERLHTVSGRIRPKYRASMKPNSVEMLTLGYTYILETVRRKLREFAAREKVADAELIDFARIDELLADEMPPPPLDMDDAVSRAGLPPRPPFFGLCRHR